MSVVVLGVRHHSPACARVVADTIARLRPTYVLIEGPADFTDTLPELRRDHTLPIALFSHVRRGTHTRVSWTAFTEWSPEWVAVRAAAAVGAEVRFIDLPTWDSEIDSTAEEYGPVAADLPRRLGVDTMDAVWDHVVESCADALTTSEVIALLDEYFDTVRSGDDTVTVRERSMVSWIRAARDRAGVGTTVVICGGRHRPALLSELAAAPVSDGSWPTITPPDADLDVGHYLIPYSYRRIDLESPWWYERLWTTTSSAADVAAEAIVRDLRFAEHSVSTTDFIGFRTQIHGLAALRGHLTPTRLDILDAAASTLVDEALPSPLPWTRLDATGRWQTHPVIASCLNTMRGNRIGALDPATPAPGLVHHVDLLLEELDLSAGPVDLDLLDTGERRRSRTLHQLRILDVPGFDRLSGPTTGSEIATVERWSISDSDDRTSALTEAAALGHTLVDAAGAALETSLSAAASDVAALASVIFDAVLSGLDAISINAASTAVKSAGAAGDLAEVGVLLRTVVDLWRHDTMFDSRGSTVLAAIIDAAATRVVALARRTRSGSGGAEFPRLEALAALSDTMIHAGATLSDDPADELAMLARDSGAAVDIRGAALGTAWESTSPKNAASAVRSIPPDRLGDWLSGLFAVARERFLDAGSSAVVLDTVDSVVDGLTDQEFLIALPALRQSFEFFPPREREIIARRFAAPAAPPTRASDVGAIDEGTLLDARVDEALLRLGLQ